MLFRSLKTAGWEGLTETGQQFLERLQAGLNITDEEARKEYKDDSALQNIIDGIVDLYLSTLYKLKFLA